MKSHRWSSLLALACPDEIDSLLLRSCLLKGLDCGQAFFAWTDSVGEPREYFRSEHRGLKRLLPLLWANLRKNRVEVGREFSTVLRAAYFQEELRSRAFRREMWGVIHQLRGLEMVTLRGVALAASVYEAWPLRHCHDLDLWVSPQHLEVARARLADSGMVFVGEPMESPGAPIFMRTQSGFQVCLSSSMLPTTSFSRLQGGLFENRRMLETAEGELAVPRDADQLISICGAAMFSSNRRNLRWVCDAHFLLCRSSHLDWEHLSSVCVGSGLGFPLAIMFNYLRREFDSPVPLQTLETLAKGGLSSESEGELCHSVILRSGLPFVVILKRAGSMRLRFLLLRHLLFPTPSQLALEKGVDDPAGLLWEYCSSIWGAFRRLCSFLGRSCMKFLRRRYKSMRATDHREYPSWHS